MTENLEMRKEVVDFAQFMEKILRDNDYKSSWKDMTVWDIFARLQEEVEELRHALRFPSADWQNVQKECVDVANFAMMLADVIDITSKRENG